MMEEEHSPVLDIVGDEPEASRPEVSVIGSSSEDFSRGGSDDGVDAKGEDSGVLDLHESEQSYDFGASTVIVGLITIAAAAHAMLGLSGPKGACGVLGSKIIGSPRVLKLQPV
jgi:hypothetical protein